MAIARLFVKNPPIVLLGRSTSALDSRTEADIQGAPLSVVVRPHVRDHRASIGYHLELRLYRRVEFWKDHGARGRTRTTGSGGRVQGHVGRAGSEFGGRGGQGGAFRGRAPVSGDAGVFSSVRAPRCRHARFPSRRWARFTPRARCSASSLQRVSPAGRVQQSAALTLQRHRSAASRGRRRASASTTLLSLFARVSARCLPEFPARHPSRKKLVVRVPVVVRVVTEPQGRRRVLEAQLFVVRPLRLQLAVVLLVVDGAAGDGSYFSSPAFRSHESARRTCRT